MTPAAGIVLTFPQQATSCHCTAEDPRPHPSPPTLTRSKQNAILRATACNPRNYLVYSLAVGTGLRLAEIVGLNVENVYSPEAKPRNRLESGQLRSCVAYTSQRGASLRDLPHLGD